MSVSLLTKIIIVCVQRAVPRSRRMVDVIIWYVESASPAFLGVNPWLLLGEPSLSSLASFLPSNSLCWTSKDGNHILLSCRLEFSSTMDISFLHITTILYQLYFHRPLLHLENENENENEVLRSESFFHRFILFKFGKFHFRVMTKVIQGTSSHFS